MTKQELLDVLKLDEEEQLNWLWHNVKGVKLSDAFGDGIFRLAFDLRDKAVKKGGFIEAAHQVRPFIDTDWMEYATPIEIIIASLIVLEAK